MGEQFVDLGQVRALSCLLEQSQQRLEGSGISADVPNESVQGLDHLRLVGGQQAIGVGLIHLQRGFEMAARNEPIRQTDDGPNVIVNRE